MSMRIKLLLSTLLIVALASSHWAMFHYGRATGELAQSSACQQGHIDGMTELLREMSQWNAEAQAASDALQKTISARQLADAQTTREIRDALRNNEDDRADCVLDANVLRLLTAARDRANQAAASGIGGTVPRAAGAGR